MAETATPPTDAATPTKLGSAFSVTVAPVAAIDAKSPASFVITVTPNAMAAASAEPGAAAPDGHGPGSVLLSAASAN